MENQEYGEEVGVSAPLSKADGVMKKHGAGV